MELLDAHRIAMSGFDRTVHQVTDDQWDRPTPCTEWTVRDLVNHLVYEQLWVPELLRGATLAEVGDRFDGDVLGADPIGAWERSSAAARAAWTEPGVLDRSVHVTSGVIDAREYGWQMVTDLAVHGWDLAVGIAAANPIGDELANDLLGRIAPHVDAWQGLGIFDPPVDVNTHADPASRLVALLGRRPR
ncbi:MAG: TIGR03086 family metal-binding protein [Haloechinothrix sp.]